MPYDRPEVLESALAVLGAAGVGDRCETVAGDGTGPVPSGADAYVLNGVVRDREDEQATALLLDHRTAMAPTARLIPVHGRDSANVGGGTRQEHTNTDSLIASRVFTT